MRSTVSLGRVFGISIGLHYSWFLIAALITWSLAAGYFPASFPGWSTAAYWAAGFVTAVLFFGSVLVHELAHSLVSIREGVPVRGITLFIFGGVSQISDEPKTAGAEFRIAIVGPLTSVIIGVVSIGIERLAGAGSPTAAVAEYIGRINLLLAVFNLIPGFPLDGGRVLRSILWKLSRDFRQSTRWASYAGQAVALIFIIAGIWMIFSGSFFNGLWIAFIGWFLNNAAASSYQQVQLRELLSGVTARNVMVQECTFVPSALPVDQLVNQQVLSQARRCFIVGDSQNVRGLITLHNIRTVPREQWDDTTAGQIMTPVDKLLSAKPDDDVLSVLMKMEEADVNQVPVVDEHGLQGMVTRESLLRFIRTRSEIGI